MPIITLTTDYGLKDPYVAILKALLYNELNEVQLVDISHDITPFNLEEAAYIINNTYTYFPKGTIHIIGIDAEIYNDKKYLAAKIDGHYFICADNGVLALICQKLKPEELITINIEPNNQNNIFPERSIFIQAAAHIARGGQLHVLGTKIAELPTDLIVVHPISKSDSIIGNIIYIDNYGNVITNISKSFFIKNGKKRNFEINVRNHKFKTIYSRYTEIIPTHALNDMDYHGNPMVLFNSNNFLEIAVYKSNLDTVGGASTLLGLTHRDTITIQFI